MILPFRPSLKGSQKKSNSALELTFTGWPELVLVPVPGNDFTDAALAACLHWAIPDRVSASRSNYFTGLLFSRGFITLSHGT